MADCQSRFIELFGDPVYNTKKLPTKRLAELGSLDRGRSQHRPRNAPELLGGPYPLIQTGEVANAGLYITGYSNTYSELGLKQSKMWKAGTLCITIAANIAQTSILTFDACFPDSVVGFIPGDSISAIYMHYWFGFFQKILEEQAPQVAQKNINLKILSDLSVVVPNQEQQKDFIAFVEQTDKSRFIELFGDPIANQFGWDTTNIGAIVTEVRYGTSRPAVENGKYPYLRMNNLTFDGHLDLKDLKRIDIPEEEIEKCIVRKGDVLFNRTNSVELVGKTCVFDLDEEMVIAGYIIRVRLGQKMIPTVFSAFMNSQPIKELFRGMAKGAVNQANINAQELQSIRIYLPPIDLQEQFAAFVEQTDKSKLCGEMEVAA